MSQISTSEQSENEDIRNFDNYVDEVNRKKNIVDSSPLHCPFPNIESGRGSKTSSGAVKLTDLASTAKNVEIPILPKLAGLSVPVIGQIGTGNKDSCEYDDFKSAPVIPNSSGVSNSVSSNANQNNDDDFADFKSASVPSNNSSVQAVSTPREVSLIGDEDKYGALRSLTFDSPLPSLSDISEDTPNLSDCKSKDADNEEWADFSSAPTAPVDKSGLSSDLSLPMTPPSVDLTDSLITGAPTPPVSSADKKDQILKMFEIQKNLSNLSVEGSNKSGKTLYVYII